MSIKLLLISGNKNVIKDTKSILSDKKFNLEILNSIEALDKDELVCDIGIVNISKNERFSLKILEEMAKHVPTIVILDTNNIKSLENVSIKIMQLGAKTIIYNIKDRTLIHSIERIYDIEYMNNNDLVCNQEEYM